MLGVVGSNVCLPTSLRPFERGARDGAVVRAHASHQCGPGSNPGVDAIMWVEFAPRGFSAGIPLFPFPQKPTSPNSNSNRNQVDGEPLCGCATYKSLFIYFIEAFIYLIFRGPAPSLISNLSCFFLVLRHSVVHSTIALPPLVWRRPCREKFKNSSVFWVSMSQKRYLPTVLASNNFTIKYLCFSKAVLKKLNNIKICLYLKLKRLKRDRTLYKLRKKRIYNGWLR